MVIIKSVKFLCVIFKYDNMCFAWKYAKDNLKMLEMVTKYEKLFTELVKMWK